MKRVIFIMIAFLTFMLVPCNICAAAVYQDNNIQNSISSYRNKQILVLGDSIGTGYKLDSIDQSYSKLLSDKLSMQYKNMAINGLKSCELLKSLDTKDVQYAIKSSHIVNISIGGNDLMQPVLEILEKELKVNKNSSNSVDDYMNFYRKVTSGIYDDILNGNIIEGYKDFCYNFPLIIKEIHKINPNCKILLQTINNPLNGVSAYSYMYDIIDKYICDVNNVILSQNSDYVIVADIYKYLKKDSGIYISNIGDMDIHPNKYGHYDMYLCIYKELFNGYPDNVKVDIPKISTDIEYDGSDLAPTIYIYPEKGYRVSGYLDVKYDGKKGITTVEKVSSEKYKIILSPHHLYKDITISGDLLKTQDSSTGKSEEFDKNEQGNENSSKIISKVDTGDYLYLFVFIFIICVIFIVYRLIKNRKE